MRILFVTPDVASSLEQGIAFGRGPLSRTLDEVAGRAWYREVMIARLPDDAPSGHAIPKRILMARVLVGGVTWQEHVCNLPQTPRRQELRPLVRQLPVCCVATAYVPLGASGQRQAHSSRAQVHRGSPRGQETLRSDSFAGVVSQSLPATELRGAANVTEVTDTFRSTVQKLRSCADTYVKLPSAEVSLP